MTTNRSRRRRVDWLVGLLSIGTVVLGTAGASWAGESVLGAGRTTEVSSAPQVPEDFIPGKVVPLAHGHAHNDYRHELPLTDALEHGFTSVEVDIFQVGDELLVGHDLLDAVLRGETLTELYLGPLKAWTVQNEGKVFADPKIGFTLVVDVKSSPVSTYAVLDRILSEYRLMLTRFSENSFHHGPVTVVVSGFQAESVMAEQKVRYAAYDGRAADLDAAPDLPVAEMPLVSESWPSLFSWNGTGIMPADQREKLHALARKAHEQGRRLRLYDTPAQSDEARESVWRAEMAAKVDLLNVDSLDAGQEFLLQFENPSRHYVRW